jgi:hypothetical protein
MRSLGAIVFGFLYIALLSFGADILLRTLLPGAFDATGRVSSTPVLLLVIGYVAVFAISGCYFTARLAPNRPLGHAMILGVLGLLFSTAGIIKAWNTAPPWYHIVSLLLVLPYAWIGGSLRQRELERQAPARAAAPA